MSQRKTNYIKVDSNMSREERMKRLKAELKEHVRFLSDFTILSPDWLRMADSIQQISNVAFMETHLTPSEQNPLLQQGKKDQGTLWDQERDELTIRIILEEGKLNLLLRILHLYKVTSRKDTFLEMQQAASKDSEFSQETVISRCRQFEEGIGLLLRYALNHVEALQILDIPELLTHIKEVLEDCAAQNEEKHENYERKQDCVIAFYLANIAEKLESLDEERVCSLIQEHDIMNRFLDHIHKHYLKMREEVLVAATTFFASFMTSDAFTTEPDSFISDSSKKKLIDLPVLFVDELLKSQRLVRKNVLPLLDNVAKYARKHGKSTAEFKPLLKADDAKLNEVKEPLPMPSPTSLEKKLVDEKKG